MRHFKYSNIKEIWVEQETDWSCVVNALRMCLRFFGFDAEEREIVDHLAKRGYFVYFEKDYYMFCPPYAALFLKLHKFNVVYRTTLNRRVSYYGKIIVNEKKFILEDLENAEDRYTKSCYKALLDFIDIGGVVIFHQPYFKINKKIIMSSILQRRVVIVLVTAKDYYGIDEDWMHALTLVPHCNSFYVFDGFKYKGYQDKDFGDKWDRALEAAKKFKWDRIVDMIEVWR